MENLPTRLLRFRMSRKVSQTQFAKIAGCSLAAYKNYEAGKRTIPPSAILKIANHFKTPPGGIMFGSSLKKITEEEAAAIIKKIDEIAANNAELYNDIINEINDAYFAHKLNQEDEL